MDSALGIVPLTADEAGRIERLPKEEVPLLAPVRAVARIEGEDVARRRAAPPPTTQRTGVMHVRRASAYTYAMKIEGTAATLFKIGWAFNYKKRERDFNLMICSAAIGGLHVARRSVETPQPNHPMLRQMQASNIARVLIFLAC